MTTQENLGRRPPPTSLDALTTILNSPELLRGVYKTCRTAYPQFPEGGSVFYLWAILTQAGYRVPYQPSVPAFLATIVQMGAKTIRDPKEAIPGDIFAIVNANGYPIHVGMVRKRGVDGSWFSAIDNSIGDDDTFRPYRRNVGQDEETMRLPVGFFVRLGGGGG